MTKYEEWTLNTSDGKTICGVTDFAHKSGQADKVLVLVHGLTGHMNEYHIKGAANFFRDHGYDVVRFNLYDGENGRRLRDTNLQIYARDLNQVLDEKAVGYEKIFIAGHSYGGPTIMVAQPRQATALSLWDPAFEMTKNFAEKNFILVEDQNFYIWPKNNEAILGYEFIDEYKNIYDLEKCLSLSKSLSAVPIQVVAAEEGYGQDELSWHSAGHDLNERHIVMNADHCFWRGNVFQEVLDKSLEWFERF